MKDNTYEFMIKTGKYLPEENIQLNGSLLFFGHYNDQGLKTYYENSDGIWIKRTFNEQGKEIYYEDSTGFWSKKELNFYGKETYYEDSNGRYIKREYDDYGTLIYSEDSYNGLVADDR